MASAARALVIEPAFLALTETTIVPAVTSGHDVTISALRLTNVFVPTSTDAGERLVTIHKYDSANALATSNIILGPNFVLRAGDSFELGPITLPPAYILTGLADVVSSVTFDANGWDKDFN